MSKSIKDYFNQDFSQKTNDKKIISSDKNIKSSQDSLKTINFFRNYKYSQSVNSSQKEKLNLTKDTDGIKKNEIFMNENEIFVYTDGSCIHNGSKRAKAGIGIYFGPNDIRNVSRPVVGKQTNNTAELSAIIESCKILDKEINNGVKINIVTDSKYSLLCCTSYGRKCYLNNWKNPNPKSKNSEIPNLELVKKAYELSLYPNINLIKVEAHTGKKDKLSLGNEEADRLANLAIGRNAETNNKIYLNVPFQKKDQIKHLGGKWDRNKKKWYIMQNLSELKKDKINLILN